MHYLKWKQTTAPSQNVTLEMFTLNPWFCLFLILYCIVEPLGSAVVFLYINVYISIIIVKIINFYQEHDLLKGREHLWLWDY